MPENDWVREFPGAVTVCDENGVIIAMNDEAARVFAADGGRALLGTNVLDCHPEPARTKLAKMMSERRPNVYTIDKAGVRKLIFQSPWTENGSFRGYVEISLRLPAEIPHFDRKG